MGMDCYSCRQGRTDAAELPPREHIGGDENWRLAHSFSTALPGWLVLTPRRHVTTIADLTDDEAAGLGAWQVRASRALHKVTGCEKTYVAQFAEQEGFAHVHFHIVPRMPGLPEDHRGPGIFHYLAAPPTDHVPTTEMDRLSEALTTHL